MDYFIKLKNKAIQNHILPWTILFLVLNLIVTGEGGQSENARFAMMKSMYEHKSFIINDYISWTDDWSKTPDGNYYSNKLPGPSILGFPFFAIVEYLKQKVNKNYTEITRPNYEHRVILSLFLQMLPLVLFLLFMNLKEEKYAIHFFALVLLFGNTAAHFMNVYMGHGMAFTFLLGFLFSFERKNYFLMGLFLSIAVLTDFAAALSLPFLVFLIFLGKKNFIKNGFNFSLGAFFPALIWCWYHIACYGSPFLTGNNFPNPVFAEIYGDEALGNVLFFPWPKGDVVINLLFGTSRGLLFTQPWVLVVLLFSFYILKVNLKKYSKEIIKDELSLLILVTNLIICAGILMNAKFLGWHGGSTPGPRYIAPMFLFVGFLGLKLYQFMPQFIKKILWATLMIAIIFKGLVISTTILLPDENLWVFMVNRIINYPSATPWLRLSIFFGLFGGTYFWVKKRERAGL